MALLETNRNKHVKQSGRRWRYLESVAYQVLGEYALHLGERLHRVQLLANLGRIRQPLHVPAEVLAELDRGTARLRRRGGHHRRRYFG
mgnify:CR=1 FL=1